MYRLAIVVPCYKEEEVLEICSEALRGLLNDLIAKGKIKTSTVKNLLKGLKQSGDVGKLYDNYPATFEGFEDWKKQADELWNSIGSLADTCDPEILKKLNIK